jgi:hypothetical protein
MSLDVDLTRKKWVSYDEFKTHEIEYDTLYSANITHNLGEMADKAGLYEALWRPHRLIDGYNIPEKDHNAEHEFEDKQEIRAKDIIPYIKEGLSKLRDNPNNGWGSYEGLLNFTQNYLDACEENPESIVKVWR